MSADESKEMDNSMFLQHVSDNLFGIQDELGDAMRVHRKGHFEYSRAEVRKLLLLFQNDALLLFRKDDDNAPNLTVCLSRIDDRASERIIRPALRSIRAVEWLELMINTTLISYLDKRQAILVIGKPQLSSLRLTLEMVSTMIENLIPTAVRLLNDLSLDHIECRNRIIVFIRAGLVATHKICAERLIECAAEIRLKQNKLLSKDRMKSESPSSTARQPRLSPSEIEKCQQLYYRNPEARKKDIMRELGVGSDKAQALRWMMRAKGLDTSQPRSSRRKRLS